MKIQTKDWWTRERKEQARSILLEKSPVMVDEGELIGRDPRQIADHEFDVAGIVSAPLIRVIRAKCLDCVGEQVDEVRKCVVYSCPNWPYRMGVNPFRTVNLTDEERGRRAERARIVNEARKAVS